MLSIAVYSDVIEDMSPWKSNLQDFLIETSTMAKTSCYNNSEEFRASVGSYDVYILDMDSAEDVIEMSEHISLVDRGSLFIFLSENRENVYKIAKRQLGYFLPKPIDREDFIELLKKVRKNVKESCIIVPTSLGERRIHIANFNYLDIVKRCLCYHLADGNMFDGQTLRASFEKTIKPLDEHPSLLFIAPSLLLNLENIKELNKDNIVFENDTVLYISKKAYEIISIEWHKYNRA